MTAGRGVVHSEMPVVTSGQLHGFQLWINLPAKASSLAGRLAALSQGAPARRLAAAGSLGLLACLFGL